MSPNCKFLGKCASSRSSCADRVRSMRMGFFVQKVLSGGKPLYIQRFAKNISRFQRAGLPFPSVETYNFLICFHGSKRESRAPNPWYVFGKPLYVQRFALTEKPLYKEPHSHGPTLTLFPKILSNVTFPSKSAPHRCTFPRKKKSAPPLFFGAQTRSSFESTNWQWHD